MPKLKVKRTAPPLSKDQCPRKPESKICGFSNCNLPKEHLGPHLMIDAAEVPHTKERELTTHMPIPLEFEPTSNQMLTDILLAWKLVGNDWLSPMHLALNIFSKGYRLETDLHSKEVTDGVRALHFLGYLQYRLNTESGFMVTEYKLTGKGQAAVKRIDFSSNQSLPEKSMPVTVPNIRSSVGATKVSEDCDKCDGIGALSNGKICPKCKGEGEIEVETTVKPKPKFRVRKI